MERLRLVKAREQEGGKRKPWYPLTSCKFWLQLPSVVFHGHNQILHGLWLYVWSDWVEYSGTCMQLRTKCLEVLGAEVHFNYRLLKGDLKHKRKRLNLNKPKMKLLLIIDLPFFYFYLWGLFISKSGKFPSYCNQNIKRKLQVEKWTVWYENAKWFHEAKITQRMK